MNVRKNFIQMIKEKQLVLFGHVMRRGHGTLPRIPRLVFESEKEGRQKRGRLRKKWISDIKMAMLNFCQTINDSQDRVHWRGRGFIKVVRWLQGIAFLVE